MRKSSDGTAMVDPSNYYREINAETPLGMTMILISREYGVAHIGKLPAGKDFFTHWAPMPTFKK